MRFKKFIPNFFVSLYHWFLAHLAAVIYGFPSRKLIVIGVTGTNGKSTTVLMIARILEGAGFKVGSVSSIWYKIGASEKPNPLHMTMPGRFRLQKLLRQIVQAGCQFAVLEVTSEGIEQHRHRGINFDVAVLTNLSPEHIEAHGSFEKYRSAKAKLFAGLALGLRKRLAMGTGHCPGPTRRINKVAVINLDDKNADYFLKFKADKKYGYSLNSKLKIQNSKPQLKIKNLATVKAEKVILKKSSSQFFVRNFPFTIYLGAQFNIYNGLAAICVGLSQGISLDKIKIALAKIKTVAGRMEIIQREPFTVIIDLAHTPSAVEQVYLTVGNKDFCSLQSEGDSQKGKIITVFGAAGGRRDKWKRPRLGELATKYCDIIILTNEDPYDEDPGKILSDIESGIKNKNNLGNKNFCSLLKILDRRTAISKALKLAQPSDIVLILGKGTEPTMVFANGKKIPWDDRQVAREELEKLDKKFENSSIKNYGVLDHPADLKIKAFGRTQQEVFLNMLKAMADYQLEQLPDNIKKRSGVQRKIQIKSPDLKQLLVDFLSEALYLTEVNSEIYTDIKFEKFDAETHGNASLQAKLIGQKIPHFSSPIKAVAYHDLSFERAGDHWQAVVLFDI